MKYKNLFSIIIAATISLLLVNCDYGDVTELIDGTIDNSGKKPLEDEEDQNKANVVGLWIGEWKNKNGIPFVEQHRFYADGTWETETFGMFPSFIECTTNSGKYSVIGNEVRRTKDKSTSLSPLTIQQSGSEYYFLGGDTEYKLVEPNFEAKAERSLLRRREYLNTTLIIEEGGNMTLKDMINGFRYGTYTIKGHELTFTLTSFNNTWRNDLGSKANQYDFTTPYCITADGTLWMEYNQKSCSFYLSDQQ